MIDFLRRNASNRLRGELMTKHMPQFFVILALLGALLTSPTMAQNSGSSHDDPLAGDWHGDSICQVRNGPCHDEEALYRFTPISGKTGRFSLDGHKIVDGKPVLMGTMECSFDSKQSLVECEWNRGSLHLVVDGNKMQGTMNNPDKTVARKINLKKVGS
jgi:hypothetical protein